MKLKQSKGMSLIVFTIILAVLVVVAGGVIVYLLNNPVKEKVAIQTTSSVQTNMSNNEKVEEKNETSSISNVNVVDNNKGTNLVVINDEKNLTEECRIYEYYGSEENFEEVSVGIDYIVNGNNKGKLEIKNNNKVVYTKNVEKNIIGINRLRFDYELDVFVLYQDGTVGKVVIDMKKNKYDIVEVENCKNIVRIQEIIYEHQEYGNDYELVAVDNTGKIISLDTYSV